MIHVNNKTEEDFASLAKLHYDGVKDDVLLHLGVFVSALNAICDEGIRISKQLIEHISKEENFKKVDKKIITSIVKTLFKKESKSDSDEDSQKASSQMLTFIQDNSCLIATLLIFIQDNYLSDSSEKNIITSNITKFERIKSEICQEAIRLGFELEEQKRELDSSISVLFKKDVFWSTEYIKSLGKLFELIKNGSISDYTKKELEEHLYPSSIKKRTINSAFKEIIENVTATNIYEKIKTFNLSESIYNDKIKQCCSLFNYNYQAKEIAPLKEEFFAQYSLVGFNSIEETVYKEGIDRIFKKIFDYDKFIRRYLTKDWNSYKLTRALDIKVCPYCNMNKIPTIINEDTNEKVINPELDHFLLNTKNPLFKLSFYNLVPTCNACNSRIRGSKSYSIDKNIHPYIEGFENDGVFKAILSEKIGGLVPQIDTNNCMGSSKESRIINNNKLLYLNLRYQEERQIVDSLNSNKSLLSRKMYECHKEENGIYETYEEYRIYVLKIFPDKGNHLNEQYAKARYDIAVDLGLVGVHKEVSEQDSVHKEVSEQDNVHENVAEQDSGQEDVTEQDNVEEEVVEQDGVQEDVVKQGEGQIRKKKHRAKRKRKKKKKYWVKRKSRNDRKNKKKRRAKRKLRKKKKKLLISPIYQ